MSKRLMDEIIDKYQDIEMLEEELEELDHTQEEAIEKIEDKIFFIKKDIIAQMEDAIYFLKRDIN